MKITAKHLSHFKAIIEKYNNPKYTEFPKKDNWKKLSNEELWLRLFGEVMVVGGSSPYNSKFRGNQSLQNKVSLKTLSKIKSKEAIEITINKVLRECGTRYVGNKVSPKAKCLAKNFNYINKHKGLFIEIISHVRSLKDESDRVTLLIKNFDYISSKTARDFLIGLGINTNNIAIDVRVDNIFKKIGIRLDEIKTEKKYQLVENFIIKNVCQPLEILPAKFDRILYQNYDSIK